MPPEHLGRTKTDRSAAGGMQLEGFGGSRTQSSFVFPDWARSAISVGRRPAATMGSATYTNGLSRLMCGHEMSTRPALDNAVGGILGLAGASKDIAPFSQMQAGQ